MCLLYERVRGELDGERPGAKRAALAQLSPHAPTYCCGHTRQYDMKPQQAIREITAALNASREGGRLRQQPHFSQLDSECIHTSQDLWA